MTPRQRKLHKQKNADSPTKDAPTSDTGSETDRALDDLSAAAALGITRPPKARPVTADSGPEPEGHPHRHHFHPLGVDDAGNIVEIDPGSVERYQGPIPPDVDPPAKPPSHHDPTHHRDS
jgi:hypothetical protein